jgi:polysaccharide export outer membrane protein
MKCSACVCRKATILIAAGLAMQLGRAGDATAQSKDGYILSPERGLQIKVHVLGEVANPGEYQVPDDTNVLEVISKAGGPTEFANVRNIIIKRRPDASGDSVASAVPRKILKVDLQSYLVSEKAPAMPMLAPGDVVAVPRNKLHRWKTVFGMVRDVSVVASAYLLYLRVVQNN